MNQLEKIALFRQVEKSTLRKIWAAGKVVKYNRGEYCFQAKVKNSNVYILLTGKVAIYNLTHAGKRKTIFYLGAGHILNDQILKYSIPTVNCMSLDESIVFTIPKDKFLNFMAQDFSLVQAVLASNECKMVRMSHQLKNTLGCVPLERKVAYKLWKLTMDFGIKTEKGIYIDIPLSITELADFVGAPRESTSRALKKLVERGFVRLEQKRIYVIKPEELEEFYKTGNLFFASS